MNNPAVNQLLAKIEELEYRIVDLEEENRELQTANRELAWNAGYGCFTRQGFEKNVWPKIEQQARWIIFFDIDDMHGLNKKHGYDGMNAIIKKTLARRGGDYMAGQWFSCDEFIVVITDSDPDREESDPVKFSSRLGQLFKENGAPATFAIAPVLSSDLITNVAPAHKLCQESKAHLQHGIISTVPGDPR